jgi:hypothetical protein
MASLVPNESLDQESLGAVRGWLPDDDPFFEAVEEIVNARFTHHPRTLRKPQG